MRFFFGAARAEARNDPVMRAMWHRGEANGEVVREVRSRLPRMVGRAPLWGWMGSALIIFSVAVVVGLWRERSRLPFNPLNPSNGAVYAEVPEGVTVEAYEAVGLSKVWPYVYTGGLYVGRRGDTQCLLQGKRILQCVPRIVDYDGSEDGRIWAVVARTPKGLRVIENARVGPLVEELRHFDVTGDGTVFYVARTGEAWRAWVNGEAGPEWDEIPYARCSHYGNRCVYIAKARGRYTVVDGQRRYQWYDSVCCLSVNLVGTAAAWAGESGGQPWLIVNGEPRPLQTMPVSIALGNVSGRIAWLERREQGYHVVENGKASTLIQAKDEGRPLLQFVHGDTELRLLLIVRDNNKRLKSTILRGTAVDALRRSYAAELVTDAGLAVLDSFSVLVRSKVIPTVIGWELEGFLDPRIRVLFFSGRELRTLLLPAGPKTVSSVDIAVLDPELSRARDQFAEAVRRKSVSGVVALLAPDVRSGFGDPCCGREVFRQVYELDDPNSKFWRETEKLLRGGWYVLDRASSVAEFVGPAAWHKFNGLDLGFVALFAGAPGTIGWINGERVLVKAAPTDDARAIAVVNDEPVIVQGGEWAKGFQSATFTPRYAYVVTMDGRRGWVKTDALYTEFGKRIGFKKINGQWRVSFLVEGD
ncbi:MAG TPA: hypothetical protein VNJ11_01660 [Bryobacteraceae bacterium]|nr:hypothetical protein [Bryobacteraceae bacterium]